MASSFSVPPWAEQTVIVVVNVIISFAAGSATEARKFRTINKVAPLLPMASQFVMQPLLVSWLGRLFGLNPYVLVGMILCATTPGGNGSNVAEVLFGGDVELGIFMTFTSTLVSAGAIPLNYRLLAVPLLPGQGGAHAPVPWTAVGTAAAILIGGSSLGCLVRYRDDALGRRLEKWSIKLGVLLLVGGLGVAIAQTAPVWALLDWRTFLCGALLPPWKFLATYGAARLCRFSERVAETAAMEAGEQNIAVALAILSLAFPASAERQRMLSGLMVYTLFNQAVATPLVTLLFWRWGSRRRREQAPRAEGEAASAAAGPLAPGPGAPSRKAPRDGRWWWPWRRRGAGDVSSAFGVAAASGHAVSPGAEIEAGDAGR